MVVDDVVYAPHVQATPEQPYAFFYYITIKNNSTMTVTIRARKWVVRQKTGETTVVEGDGVVGEFPVLTPGDEFSYNSCHTVAADGTAEGAYFAEGNDGKLYFSRIPKFDLDLPKWV